MADPISATIAVIATAINAVAVSVAVAVGPTVAGIAGIAAAGLVQEAIVIGLPAVIEFGALAGVSALLAPAPHLNVRGSPQSTKYDPQAPVPCVMGRYGVGGNVVYRTTSGGASKAVHGAAGNEFLTEFNVLSGLGPIKSIDSLRFGDTILTFAGQTCTGGYIESAFVQYYNPGYKLGTSGNYENSAFANHAWQNTQLGAIPSPGLQYPAEIQNANDALPEWTSSMAFSGFAASSLTLSYDVGTYAGGVPQKQWVVQGYSTYDPRQDSSYPGGAGASRWAGQGAAGSAITTARGTWTYSQNPIIHALNYALGFYYPDPNTGGSRLYAGIGAGVTGVDVAAFVAAANVADVNGWIACGQWTTGDGKWSVLTAMLQAGGATPINDRGRISCMVSTPRTSLGTITAADLAGDITLDSGTSMRERINTVYPRYTSEPHRWALVQADTPVKAAGYIAEDGGVVRSKTLDFEYVPAVNQACQLAAYAICDGREIPAIVLQGKPHLRGYAVGDCLTVNIPEAGLGGMKVVVTKRSTSIATGGVTLTCRSETDGKHAYSLGVSGVAPATPMISGYDPSIVPAPAGWTALPATLSDPASGEITHVIQINGATIDNVYATTVVVSYAPVTTVGGVDTLGATQSQTFAATVQTINLDLPAGRWHVWLHYITVSGAEGSQDQLDLGVFTVAPNTAAYAAKLPGGAIFGDAGATVTSTLQAITDVTNKINSYTGGTDYSSAINNLNGQVQTIDGLISLSNPTSGGIGAAVISAQSSINYLSGNTVTTSTYNGLVGTVNGNTSRIGNLESGTTGPYSALAQRASTLEAQVGTPSGSGTLYAQVAALSSASAGSGYASAQSVTDLKAIVGDGSTGGLSGRLTTVESAYATNAQGYATVSYVQGLQASVAVGPNIVPDGSFSVAANSANATTWNIMTVPGSAGFQVTDLGTRLITGTTALTSSTTFDIRSKRFPLSAGATYTLQGCPSASDNAGNFAVQVRCYRDGSTTSLTGIVGTLPPAVSAAVPGVRVTALLTAPANTTQAEIQVTGNVDVANYQLQMVKLEPGSVATPWTDQATAGSLAASVTTTETAVTTLKGFLAASATWRVQAGNQISEIDVLAADGTTQTLSVVKISTGLVIFETPSGHLMTFGDALDANGQPTGKLVVDSLQVGNLNIEGSSITNSKMSNGSVANGQLVGGAVTDIQFISVGDSGYLTNQSGSQPAPVTTPPPSGGGGSSGRGKGAQP